MAQYKYERGRLAHEKDERWAAVDQFALKHLHPPQSHLYEHISYAQQLAETNNLPEIEVSQLQGKFVKSKGVMVTRDRWNGLPRSHLDRAPF